jgi:hypothetical protein
MSIGIGLLMSRPSADYRTEMIEEVGPAVGGDTRSAIEAARNFNAASA